MVGQFFWYHWRTEPLSGALRTLRLAARRGGPAPSLTSGAKAARESRNTSHAFQAAMSGRVIAQAWHSFLRKPLQSGRAMRGLYERRDVRSGHHVTFSDKKCVEAQDARRRGGTSAC